MSRRNAESTEEFECIGLCEDPPTWMVEGRFNAAGEFEAIEEEETHCPECAEVGEPTDKDIELADL